MRTAGLILIKRSKRLKDKWKKKVGGKELYKKAYDALKEHCDEVFVYCSDKKYCQALIKYGATFAERHKGLDEDHVTVPDVVTQFMQDTYVKEFDNFIYVDYCKPYSCDAERVGEIKKYLEKHDMVLETKKVRAYEIDDHASNRLKKKEFVWGIWGIDYKIPWIHPEYKWGFTHQYLPMAEEWEPDINTDKDLEMSNFMKRRKW